MQRKMQANFAGLIGLLCRVQNGVKMAKKRDHYAAKMTNCFAGLIGLLCRVQNGVKMAKKRDHYAASLLAGYLQ